MRRLRVFFFFFASWGVLGDERVLGNLVVILIVELKGEFHD